jgi:hypothetical protein
MMTISLLIAGANVFAMLFAVYSWITEPELTQEELERAEYRSKSWPSKPGQSPFDGRGIV